MFPEGTPLYLPYGYVPPQRVGFLLRFQGLEMDINFAYLGLNSGMVFEGMHERICRFNPKERVICKFEVDFQNSFCWRSNPSNGNIISA